MVRKGEFWMINEDKVIKVRVFQTSVSRQRKKGEGTISLFWLLDDSKLTLDFTLDSNQSYGSTFLLQTCFPNKIYFYLLLMPNAFLFLEKCKSLSSFHWNFRFDIQWKTRSNHCVCKFFLIFEEKLDWSNLIKLW